MSHFDLANAIVQGYKVTNWWRNPDGTIDIVVRDTSQTLKQIFKNVPGVYQPVYDPSIGYYMPKNFTDDMARYRATLEMEDGKFAGILKPDPGCPKVSKEWNLDTPGKILSDFVEKSTKKIETKHAYHVRSIPKGKTGEFSKITEEYNEALDAFEQGNTPMLFLELADLIGSIERFLAKNHPSVTLESILKMTAANRAAFETGKRLDRDAK